MARSPAVSRSSRSTPSSAARRGINQTSCNKDYSCLEGDCPSFLTVHEPKRAAVARPVQAPGVDLPEPEAWVGSADVRVRLVGIGGTGVVTVSHVLGVAALLDGRQVSGLDQTGLSQKAGGVVSDLYITESPVADSVTPPSASVDVLLVFDLIGAAMAPILRVADRDLTVAIVSDHVTPTAQMVLDVDAPIPDSAAAHAAIDDVTRARDNVYVDATRIAERLLGDATCANVVLLGAAWQRGTLPLTRDALESALRLNGVAVEANLAAFAWGRASVAAPEHVDSALSERPVPVLRSAAAVQLAGRVTPENGALRGALELRIDDLIGWGGLRAATSYAETIARVHAVETERIPDSSVLTEAVARGLHKLIAYKDEYEVARLHIEGLATLPPHTKLSFYLHPPLLRALGLQRKMRLGSWFVPVLRVLQHGRRLRGTPLDPFGHTHVRRVERALPYEYLALVDLALSRLTAATLDQALEIAALPELVRGYEQIKLAGVERFRARAAELSAQLLAGGGAA